MKKYCVSFLFVILLIAGCSHNSKVENILLDVKVNGKIGFINNKGKIIIEPQFDNIDDISGFSEGYIGIKKDNKWGFMNKNGDITCSPQFDSIFSYHEGLAAIQINKKWGFINEKGKIVIFPQFLIVKNFCEGLAAVYINDKWGFINKKGDIKIAPEFFVVENFKNGFAVVEINPNKKYVFGDIDNQIINKRGGKIVPIKTCRRLEIKENIILVDIPLKEYTFLYSEHDNKVGFLDTNGNWLIQPKLGMAGQFYEGLAWVVYENNLKTEYVIRPSLLGRGNVKESIDKYDKKLGYINNNGEMIIEANFATALDDFHEGLAVFNVSKSETEPKKGYLNKKGKIVIPAQFFYAGNFKNNYAVIGIGEHSQGSGTLYQQNIETKQISGEGKDYYLDKNGERHMGYNPIAYGFIDKKGNIVINPKFYNKIPDSLYFDKDSLCPVFFNDKWGMINTKGEMVIKNKYDGLDRFTNTLARYKINDKYGYLNKKGEEITKPIFTSASPQYYYGVFYVEIDNKSGYLDKEGKYIWKPTK